MPTVEWCFNWNIASTLRLFNILSSDLEDAISQCFKLQLHKSWNVVDLHLLKVSGFRFTG